MKSVLSIFLCSMFFLVGCTEETINTSITTSAAPATTTTSAPVVTTTTTSAPVVTTTTSAPVVTTTTSAPVVTTTTSAPVVTTTTTSAPVVTTTTSAPSGGTLCTSFDVSVGCCASTGCDAGGCGTGAACSNPPFSRCYQGGAGC